MEGLWCYIYCNMIWHPSLYMAIILPVNSLSTIPSCPPHYNLLSLLQLLLVSGSEIGDIIVIIFPQSSVNVYVISLVIIAVAQACLTTKSTAISPAKCKSTGWFHCNVVIFWAFLLVSSSVRVWSVIFLGDLTWIITVLFYFADVFRANSILYYVLPTSYPDIWDHVSQSYLLHY